MTIEFFLLMLCTFSFLVVSVALAAKFVVESYLEYIQVVTGIQVITKKQMEEASEQMDEVDDLDDYM